MVDDLSVEDAALALGTSPQTVRALLRKGELTGRKQPWGSRYVWVPSRSGVDEFISVHGRLDGRRRRRGPVPARRRESVGTEPGSIAPVGVAEPGHDDRPPTAEDRSGAGRQRPFVLRPRGRATVIVTALGLPVILLQGASLVLPDLLWFQELDQGDYYARMLSTRVSVFLAVAIGASLFFAASIAYATRGSLLARSRTGRIIRAAVSLVPATLLGAIAMKDWQTYALRWHEQDFGVVDPTTGRDVGYFVFALPFEIALSNLAIVMIAVALCGVLAIKALDGSVGIRPWRASPDARRLLAVTAAGLLLAVAYRVHLLRYALALRQPDTGDRGSFAGLTFADDHVRGQSITGLALLAVALAGAALVIGFGGPHPRGNLLRGRSGAVLAVVAVVVTAVVGAAPSLVQRFVVDPQPLTAEEPYLERSIAATRAALALDTIETESYAPSGAFAAADYLPTAARFDDVPTWDSSLLESRMDDLVSDTRYLRTDRPSLDVTDIDGRSQLTAVTARELDLSRVSAADSWGNDRLAYTHGVGLIRMSGTEVAADRGPRIVDDGLRPDSPRIYFGDLDGSSDGAVATSEDETTNEDSPAPLDAAAPAKAAAPAPAVAGGDWVVANTTRAEVDLRSGADASSAEYHYTGSGGIELSSVLRRAAFAVALGSKELLLSNELTTSSRLLVHRDVHDRLSTLAPFIQWDSDAVPLTWDDGLVYAVNGYTTSANYPSAERVTLGTESVSYARATVRATVDAFTGHVDLYLVDDSEPVARAWSEAFPTLFRSATQMPAQLADRMRYPIDLFNAQATAYERLHTTRPDQYVSQADAWARPVALAGSLEVAGGVDFDEDDEGELQLTLRPEYTYSPPPGATDPQLVLSTYYVPRGRQNLVGTLTGWVDEQGRPRLSARQLPRDTVTLGPAQVSRLVFATPRVRDLLGLRNLEIRDLDRSSLDSVILGRPRLLFLRSGIVQVQSLFEGSRGPGAARLLGVTAYVNGQAGLGESLAGAVRQALNMPPSVRILAPTAEPVVGRSVQLQFDVENAQRARVTISSNGGVEHPKVASVAGRVSVPWVPKKPGTAHVRITVWGLDGTRVNASDEVEVSDEPPTVRLVGRVPRAVVGEPVRVTFQVAGSVGQLVRISTRSGVVFEREYLLRDGTGVVTWTPTESGPADLLIQATGRDDQVVTRKVQLSVFESPQGQQPPVITFDETPDDPVVGRAVRFVVTTDDCLGAVARITGQDDYLLEWTLPCPTTRRAITWTPPTAGSFVFSVVADGSATSTEVSLRLTVRRP